jgi:hypothetical protein
MVSHRTLGIARFRLASSVSVYRLQESISLANNVVRTIQPAEIDLFKKCGFLLAVTGCHVEALKCGQERAVVCFLADIFFPAPFTVFVNQPTYYDGQNRDRNLND